MIVLDIKKRNRNYGIITWPYSLDFEIKTLFNLSETIYIMVEDKIIGIRKVSYIYRRISIGKSTINMYLNTNKVSLIKTNGIFVLKAIE